MYLKRDFRLTGMKLNLGLPLVHLDRVMSHEQVLRLIAQSQPDHVLLLGVLSCYVTLCTPQCQWWGGSVVLDIS